MADLKNIGEYEVLETLGEGGFGIVYKARAANGTLTAVKQLNAQALDNEKVVKKFFHEAMILAKLDHPNITKLFEFFPAGDAYAIVMEYVEGVTLKELIIGSGDHVAVEKATGICQQILGAFYYAHNNGVIHRDIKPGNIMINKDGVVKIMDFGIAKISSAASSDTRTTWKWGAPHYMAPERFYEDGVIDSRSDIYSLGVVFHETLTGRRPFESNDTVRIISCHLNEIPKPLETYAPDIPEYLNAAILRSLEKDPNDRYSDCLEYSQAIGGGETFEDTGSADIEDDATFVVQDGTIHAAEEKTLLSPKSQDSQRDTSLGDPTKGRATSSRLFRYLMGLLVLAALIVTGHFYQEDLLLFIKKRPEPVKTAMRPHHEKNAKGYWQTRHPTDKALMVEIPAGDFTMGSDNFKDEKPIQRIRLEKYYLDQHPVTRSRFQAFVDATGYQTTAEKQGFGIKRKSGKWEKEEDASWKTNQDPASPNSSAFPVTQVSHKDAIAYCQWANKTLPTEAQWEKASRGPDGSTYPWGKSLPSGLEAHFNRPDSQPVAVNHFGAKGLSAYGVSGMAGNVYQWCLDWYAPGVREYTNPQGPKTGSERVVKGGSYLEGPISLRAANRDRYPPDFSSDIFGFRCACKAITRQ